jgi:hypothetical protein
MANNKNSQPRGGNSRRHQQPVGVWNRGLKSGPVNPIRVRTKRLDEISGDKIALAYWLLSKQLVRDGSDEPLDEASVRRYAEGLDKESDQGPSS